MDRRAELGGEYQYNEEEKGVRMSAFIDESQIQLAEKDEPSDRCYSGISI
jgi:hypothetical protein